MERRSPRKNAPEGAVKAAAWAWYQRGGLGSDDKSIEEAGVRRVNNRVPRPSRFKLEAMRRSEALNYSFRSQNSLMDSYEIEMISKRFESLTQHVIDDSNQGVYIYDLDLNKRLLQKTSSDKKGSEKKGMKKLRIWSVCGSAADVLEPRRLNRRHRQMRN